MALTHKAEMTNFDVSVVCRELNSELKDYFIENIYQINFSTLLIRLNKPASSTKLLLLEAGRRIHLTRYALEKPASPPSFCKALRRHLLNGRVSSVEQPDFERIAVLNISASRGNFSVLIELFAKGNIILTDENGTIVQALTYRKMRDRWVIRGEKFNLPPKRGLDPEKITFEEFSAAIKQEKIEVVKTIPKTIGVSGLYAEEFLELSGVEKTLNCSQLTERAIQSIWDSLKQNLAKRESPNPCMVYDHSGRPLTVLPFPLSVYKNMRVEYYPSFNMALDEAFTRVSFEAAEGEREKQAAASILELERILNEQQAKFKEMHELEDKNRKIGDSIYKFAGELHNLISIVNENRKAGKNWDEIELELTEAKKEGKFSFTSSVSFDAKENSMKVKIENMEFTLNLGLTVYQNASLYYEKSKAFHDKKMRIQQPMRETVRGIEESKKKVEAVKAQIKKPVKLAEKKWFEKFRHFNSSDGFLIISGKDAMSNEVLIKRYTSEGDVIFHADVFGAPFTVVKAEGKIPPPQTLYEAAQFTACYSRAWRDGFSSADVYYVKHQQVGKSAPSGQYLPRGSFTITGQRNYLRKIPLKLTIGVKVYGEPHVYIGPPSTVRSVTAYYIEIMPGTVRGRDLAVKIRHEISGIVPKEFREKVTKIPLESFAFMIPYGKASLSEKLSTS